MNFWRIANTTFGIAGIVLVIFFVFKSCWDKNVMDYHCRKYTIIIVKNIDHRWTKSAVFFDYKINGNDYFAGDLIYDDSLRYSIKKGGRYYAKFCEDDPEHIEVIFNRPVPYNFDELPSEGWDEIP